MSDTHKVVYNASNTGLGLTREASYLYNLKRHAGGLSYSNWFCNAKRDDPMLVEVIEELKDAANNGRSELRIAEIPIEYKNCFTIFDHDTEEVVVCNPAELVAYMLRPIDVDSLSEAELRVLMKKSVGILNGE